MRKVIYPFVACAVATALVVSTAGAQDKRLIDEIIERGELRVGLSSFAPWVMRDKQGDFIGFEIDVATKLADDLGIELKVVPTKWDGIIPALLTGKFDLIIAGMSITAKRALKVNFSVPYAHSGLDVVVNKDKLPGITELAQLNKKEVVLVLRRGVSGLDEVRELLPNAAVKLFDDEASCRQEVINGNAHAWVSSAPSPAFAAAEHPNKLYLPFGETFARSSESVAMRRGDADTLAFINGWVTSNLNSGWIKKRHNYWFRGREWAGLIDDS